MKVVIQCAARKDPAARAFLVADGRRVVFVARPDLAPRAPRTIYARPDDASDDGRSWRRRLLAYNENPRGNPFHFLPAYRLYAHGAYVAVVDRFGPERVFILSAGWGLIPASFLTPYYDITFSASAELWKRRRYEDRYEDFSLMCDDADEIVFLGGKDYLPLFCRLTAPLRANKRVFFNSADRPELPAGFTPVRYRTTARTNWHYECARHLVARGLRGFS